MVHRDSWGWGGGGVRVKLVVKVEILDCCRRTTSKRQWVLEAKVRESSSVAQRWPYVYNTVQYVCDPSTLDSAGLH